MRTKINELLGVDHPIILAAMAWVTNAEMVAAICNAGALGTLGPNAGASVVTKDVDETGERLREQINKVKYLTDKPFAVNFVVGTAGLDNDFSERCIKVGIEEQVPVAIVSQGSAKVHTARLQEAGIKVVHVCASVAHAVSAEKAGVDAVVASGTEGGGHSGFDQNTTFALVPQIASAVRVPVIAGGGVADGRQLAAALALGAEGVYMGTRFIATSESPAHERFKQAILDSWDGDTFAIRHGSMAKPGTGNSGFTGERRGSLRLILSDKFRQVLVEHGGQVDFSKLTEMQKAVPMEMGGSVTAAALIYGDPELPLWAAGQGVGLIESIVPCRALVEKIMGEARGAMERVCQMQASK